MDVIEKINYILKKANISKVNLAFYLGVSRQMVYNYLHSKDLSKLPNEKIQLLFELLEVKSKEELLDKEITSDYLQNIGSKLLNCKRKRSKKEEIIELNGFNKEEIRLIKDINLMLRNILMESKNREGEGLQTIRYLSEFIGNFNKHEELKYIMAYFSKEYGLSDVNNFVYNETNQYILESIMFSAMNIYIDGGASRTKIGESHKKWEDLLARKKEDKLSYTQELNTAKIKALSLLGYREINADNYNEVRNKIDEIMAGK